MSAAQVWVGSSVYRREYPVMGEDRYDERSEEAADLRAEYAEEWAEFCEVGWAGRRFEDRLASRLGGRRTP